MVRDLHLAGMSVTAENVVDAAQVRATTAAIDGGPRRRRPRLAGRDRRRPGGRRRGAPARHRDRVPVVRDRRRRRRGAGEAGERAVTDAARATALELRGLGFTWVFAPVADVTIGAADPTIGTRSPSTDPAVAARAVAAAVRGLRRRGAGLDHQALPGPRQRDGRQPRDAAGPRDAARGAAPTRPAAVRGCGRGAGPGRHDGASRRGGARPGRAVEPGAPGLRLPARRPRLRGCRDHRLAGHGRGADAGLPRGAGAAGRRRPAADAGGPAHDAPARRGRDPLGRGPARSGPRRPRPGSSRSSCGSSGSPPAYPCRRMSSRWPSRRRPR